MRPTDISVPVSVEVSVSEVMKGVFEIKGVLRYAEDTLTVEYRMRGARSKQSDVETFHLPLEALREVVLKAGMAGAKIILRPKRLTTLAQVPWTSRDAIVLLVKRVHRKQAAALVAQLQQALSERGAEVWFPRLLSGRFQDRTEVGVRRWWLSWLGG